MVIEKWRLTNFCSLFRIFKLVKISNNIVCYRYSISSKMADAMVERRPTARFFCHRCNVEFEDVLQDYICPYCASGFIEQLEATETEGSGLSGDVSDVSDADMSNLDDTDEFHQTISHPMLNDLAFLMSGGRLRRSGRPETFLEQLVWSLTGGAAGAAAAGAPLVVVGAPGDYVVGGEGLDAVVTQLLGQLENAGPPPLPREQIAALPREHVTPEQAAADTTCSVCWETYKQGEQVSRLECEHTFHSACIEPWLRLHATCPICRRSLLPPDAPPPAVPARPPSTVGVVPPPTTDPPRTISIPRLVVRRIGRRAPLHTQTWDSPRSSDSSASASGASSVSTAGVWAAPAPAPAPAPAAPTTAAAGPAPSVTSLPSRTSTPSSAALDSTDTSNSYNMDIDFD